MEIVSFKHESISKSLVPPLKKSLPKNERSIFLEPFSSLAPFSSSHNRLRPRLPSVIIDVMDASVIVDLSSKAMTMVLALSLPSILLATFVGLGVSLLQALTQVQEQTLGFVVKLICITLALVLTAHWMGMEMQRYTESIFTIVQQQRCR